MSSTTHFENDVYAKFEDTGILPESFRASMPSTADLWRAVKECAFEVSTLAINPGMNFRKSIRAELDDHNSQLPDYVRPLDLKAISERYSNLADDLNWKARALNDIADNLHNVARGCVATTNFERITKLLCEYRQEKNQEVVQKLVREGEDIYRFEGRPFPVGVPELIKKYGIPTGYESFEGTTHSEVQLVDLRQNKPLLYSAVNIFSNLPEPMRSPFPQAAVIAARKAATAVIG